MYLNITRHLKLNSKFWFKLIEYLRLKIRYFILLDAVLHRLSEPSHGKRNVILFDENEIKDVENEYKRWKDII